jgi:hypothetical protein
MFLIRRCAVILALTIGYAGIALPAHADSTVISIARARSLPLGTVVTVAGTATTPSGWLESSSFDKGFGLQDRSAGIYVSVTVQLNIEPRDQVRVTGALRDSFGLLQLVPADAGQVVIGGKGPAIRPALRRTGAVNESTEASLVRVIGRVTQAPVSDLPFGFIFHVDDGSGDLTIFVSTQPGIDLSGLTVGRLVTVAGFSGQFSDHYEINPRFQQDIIILA